MRRIPVRLWFLALFSGVLQIVPFPVAGPVPVWRTAVCWVALLPLLVALLGRNDRDDPVSIRDGVALAYGCGVLWYLGNCYWIYQTMHLYGGLTEPVALGILILFALYLGFYHALFGAVLMVIRRSGSGRQGALLLTPFVWVAVELARARITGLPWDLLGVAQVDNRLLTRMAPFTGAYGLSFFVAAVNALWLLRLRLRQRRFTRTLLTGAGVGVILLYVSLLRQAMFSRSSERTSATATLVQENLEVGAADTEPKKGMQELLDIFARLSFAPSRVTLRGIPELAGTRMSVPEGKRAPSSLIVWPESPAPFEDQNSTFRAEMSAVARAAGAPVIVGNTSLTPTPGASDRREYSLRNSASFVSADGSFAGRYDKMHLVPFGEYVPFKRMFFFAGSLLAEVGTFEPGESRAVFEAGGHRIGTFICYESIFADEVRQFVLNGAEVLVNISNDGWYGDTSAPWQHLNMVRMRAIENHRWVLRATNTGVTAAIDPSGRVTESAPRHVRTSIQVHFGYEQDVTFYSKFGDLFAYLCAAVTTVAFGWGWVLRRRPRMH